MKAAYYNTPHVAIAVNYKAGSSSLARAVIAAHYPEIERRITGPSTFYPVGLGPDSVRWHRMCPKVHPMQRPVTALMVRHPVDRFVSACTESKVSSYSAKLSELESHGWGRDPHFWPQSRLAIGNTVMYFRFPDELDQLAEQADLMLPLPIINRANQAGPAPTADEVARIERLYDKDLVVYHQTYAD